MIEVYINEERLELDKLGFVQTFQLNDVAQIDSAQTSYTNKIKVPRTPRNTRIFSNLGLVGAVYQVPGASVNNARDEFPYGLPKCKIVESGVELVVGTTASVLVMTGTAGTGNVDSISVAPQKRHELNLLHARLDSRPWN